MSKKSITIATVSTVVFCLGWGFFYLIAKAKRDVIMSENLLEMTDEECLKVIDEVAAKMSNSGDHNTRFAPNRSVTDFILDGMDHSDDAIMKKLDARMRRFLSGEASN